MGEYQGQSELLSYKERMGGVKKPLEPLKKTLAKGQ